MKIYRIENLEGKGPWSAGKWFGIGDNWSEFHPSPKEEGYDLGNNRTYFCGARSPQELLWWFPEACHSDLENSGFRVVVYSTKKWFKKLKTQIIFKKYEATIVRTVPVREFFSEVRFKEAA